MCARGRIGRRHRPAARRGRRRRRSVPSEGGAPGLGMHGPGAARQRRGRKLGAKPGARHDPRAHVARWAATTHDRGRSRRDAPARAPRRALANAALKLADTRRRRLPARVRASDFRPVARRRPSPPCRTDSPSTHRHREVTTPDPMPELPAIVSRYGVELTALSTLGTHRHSGRPTPRPPSGRTSQSTGSSDRRRATRSTAPWMTGPVAATRRWQPSMSDSHAHRAPTAPPPPPPRLARRATPPGARARARQPGRARRRGGRRARGTGS